MLIAAIVPLVSLSVIPMDDDGFMREALAVAAQAGARGEVPVGALVVRDGVVIGRGGNQPIGAHDPTAHAEVMALRDAAKNAGNYRLTGSTLYVTLEPCFMCAGAVVNARVDRLVFGAIDPKAGAVGSLADVCRDARLNHRLSVDSGVLADACGAMLKSFFRARRAAAKSTRPAAPAPSPLAGDDDDAST